MVKWFAFWMYVHRPALREAIFWAIHDKGSGAYGNMGDWKFGRFIPAARVFWHSGPDIPYVAFSW